MPIKQKSHQHDLSLKHQDWLVKNFKNVETYTIELDEVFKSFKSKLLKFDNSHGMANSRARIRMTTLYQVAAANNGIVVGTGNKVEDFGVGFYTKYGDGGVDISPIADCMKTDVWNMARQLDILQEIIDAPPTDGLWDDGRKDQDQLNGLTYSEIEQIMLGNITDQDKIERYNEFNLKNKHKMQPIPVCILPK